jgi:hypothetical protein
LFSSSPPWLSRRRPIEAKLESKRKKTKSYLKELRMEKSPAAFGSNQWNTASRTLPYVVKLKTKGIKPTTDK